MNCGINIILDKSFTHDDSVFIVKTFPSHKSNNNVLSKSKVAIIHRWTISNKLFFFNFLSNFNNALLVNTSTIVTSFIFLEVICSFTFFFFYSNFKSISICDNTTINCDNSKTTVMSNLMFKTCSNKWSMWF